MKTLEIPAALETRDLAEAEINAAAAEFVAAVTAANAKAHAHGAPSDEVCDAADRLFAVLRTTGAIPESRRAFVVAVDEFETAWLAWKENDFADDHGHIWRTWQAAERVQHPPRAIQRESVPMYFLGLTGWAPPEAGKPFSEKLVNELPASMVLQTAKYAKWYLPSGAPDCARVQAQLGKPIAEWDAAEVSGSGQAPSPVEAERLAVERAAAARPYFIAARAIAAGA